MTQETPGLPLLARWGSEREVRSPVQATVARCPGAYRLSKRTTQQALEEIFGVLMSVATVNQWEQATTAS